jgi:hypothetical protein
MLDITRTWVPSTRVELRMDLPVQIRSGTPGYADCCAIQRGPQIVALEKAVNPAVPYLSRVGIPRDGEVLKLRPIPASTTWGTGPVYETEGVTKLSVGAEGAGKCLLKLVPFADAIDCSVWVRYADRLRSDAPPLSAYMRGRTSQLNLRLQPTDKQKISADVTESLTDENPATYCMADPSAPHLAAQIEGTDAPSDRAQPVWFAVIWPVPVAISRVVFRHGKMSPNGGWFDSSKEMPWVEIVRMRPAVDKFNDMGYLSPESAQWERIVAIDSYPETSAAPLSPVMQGSTFEARLEAPVTVQGVRVVGYAGGDYVTCSELSAFAS